MITEKDLIEAIAECQGTRNPDAKTCIKLASYYTILDHVTDDKKEAQTPFVGSYSYDVGQTYESETEFGKLAKSRDTYSVMEVIDELLETLRIMQPRLYNAFMRKLTALK